MEVATDDVPRRVDLLTELGFLAQFTRYWYVQGTRNDILAPLAVKASRKTRRKRELPTVPDS
eukprot:9930675-Lingulodinium_polyedra.AAC.1